MPDLSDAGARICYRTPSCRTPALAHFGARSASCYYVPARQQLGFTVLVVITVSTGGCDPSLQLDRAPIVGGVETDGDPGVVAIVRGDDVVCSGTVVAPRVVLTAAHCVEGGDPAALEIFIGASVGDGGVRIPVLDGRAHPEYDRDTFSDDIGLFLLAAPAPPEAAPLPLFRAPFDSSFVGRRIRLVGFGQSTPGAMTDGRKRSGESSIADYDERSFRFGPDPAQTCVGDSGGPALLTSGGVEYVAGVTSNGDPDCAVFARDIRVDVHASFVDDYVAATAEGAVGFGQRCHYDANCAEGTCATLGADSLPACTSRCDRDADCLDRASCENGLCVPAGPLPGALGAPCAGAYDCASGYCIDDRSEGPRCTVRCFESGPECPEGTECTTAAGDPTRTYCLPAPGCGCTGTSGRAAWPAALLVLLGLGRRRGRG